MEKLLLFKYVSVPIAKIILKNQSIRFTKPTQFNDAFELVPSFDIAKIKASYLGSKKDTKENLKGLESFTLGQSQYFKDQIDSVGILCLSKRFDIPLMWAHYADNYTGVVLGFDVFEGLTLEKPNTIDSTKYCDIGPVDYSENRYKYPNETQRSRLDFMYHKDMNWSYEEEWRLVRSLDTLNKNSKDIYTGNFNKKALRCIIYGPSTPNTEMMEINSIINEMSYAEVGLYVSYLDDTKFEIDINYYTSILSDEESIIYSESELSLRRFREKMLSKGELFKAMKIIEPDAEFTKFKDNIDLYTNEINKAHNNK